MVRGRENTELEELLGGGTLPGGEAEDPRDTRVAQRVVPGTSPDGSAAQMGRALAMAGGDAHAEALLAALMDAAKAETPTD